MRRTIMIVAIAATATLTVGIAGARVPHYGSEAKLREVSNLCKKRGCGSAEGRVKSDHAACKNNRRVNLYAKRPGDDEFAGFGRTTPDGDYGFGFKLVANFENRIFYVIVKRRVLGSGAVCQSDRSNELTPAD
jgi:hypothetical protein